MSFLSALTGQDAGKLAGEASKRATQMAERQYAETSPLRALGMDRLTNGQNFDFSSDYAGAPKYRELNDPLLSQARGAQGKTLAELSNGPDRVAMVRQALADFDATDAPRREQGIRRIGQKAAALGRIGNEGVGTEIGNFELAAEGERERMKNQLLRDATESAVNDKFRTADLAGNISGQSYGQAAGERGYGDSLSMQDVQNRVQQRDRERDASSTQFGEGMSLQQFGQGFSPEGAYNREAETFRQESAARGKMIGDLAGAATKFIPGVGQAQAGKKAFG